MLSVLSRILFVLEQQYFSGFTFEEYKKPIFRWVECASQDSPQSEPVVESAITVDQPVWKVKKPEKIDVSAPKWNSKQVRQLFRRNLTKLGRAFDQPLPIENRRILFVTREDMSPETDTVKQSLVRRYGEYMVDGGAGDCQRNQDGSFELRIGFEGGERYYDKYSVLKTLAHEYGHTLGERISDPLFEEMKAYAFTELFMKCLRPSVIDGGTVYTQKTLNLHQTAVYRMEQLIKRGISHQQILAHLTGENFGYTQSDDYRKALASHTQPPLF